MGQKVHPVGFRLGISKEWNSKWFVKKGFSKLVSEDIKLRECIKGLLHNASISKIEIERSPGKTTVIIYTARPGIVIGRKGAGVDKLRNELVGISSANDIFIDIQEVKRPELDAQLVSENIALQLEKRIAFRRAMKRSVTTALRLGAQGIKVSCAGRLGGAEIARTEWYRQGRVPLQTLKADMDYGFAEALTTYGRIGVKVWIYKGDVGT